MRHRLAYLRRQLDTSIWLIPLLMCSAGVLLAILVLWLERQVLADVSFFEGMAMSLASARQVLSVIAASIIGVGGVAFSVTMVALTLASGQYGPKVLRHFMADTDSKLSLGLFLATYLYSLVLLTAFRDEDRPALTVIVALVLALSAIIGFVRFIHYTATDLQADEIVQRLGGRLSEAFEELVEQSSNSAYSHDTLLWRRGARSFRALVVANTQQGYVQSIDYPGLVAWSQESDSYLKVCVRAGDFVLPGTPVLKLFAHSDDLPDDVLQELNGKFITGPVRTSTQDPEYAITQINQLAARALSPGINDPGTAISCVDAFCMALASIVDKDFPGNVFLDDQGTARVLVRATDFKGVVNAIFAPLRQYASGDVSVTVRLLEALCSVAQLTLRDERLGVLGNQGQLIEQGLDATQMQEADMRDVMLRAKRLRVATRG